MEFLQLAEQRYSVRKFKSDKIGADVIDKILQAGHFAPTACNMQPQRILVLDSVESMEKLKRCTRCHFDAPMAMLVCCDGSQCWVRKYDGKSSGEIDASIVTTHMMMEAQELGVGTTWVMHFNPSKIKEEFKLPDSYIPVAILVMGYAADDAAPYEGHSVYKDAKDIVFFNKF